MDNIEKMFKSSNRILETKKYYYLASPLYQGDIVELMNNHNIPSYGEYKGIDNKICYAKENLLPLFVEQLHLDKEPESMETHPMQKIQSNKEYLHLGYGYIEADLKMGGDLECYDFKGCIIDNGEFIEIIDSEDIEKAKHQIHEYNNNEKYKEELNNRLADIISVYENL